MIKNVFLDLDDTVFDFSLAEKKAITKTLTSFGIDANEKTVKRYSEINSGLWKKLELGELTREEVLVNRFKLLFEELGLSCDPKKARREYEKNLSVGHYFIDGAMELLNALRGKYKLFLASNGTHSVQIPRIKSSCIEEYFDAIFISEDIGYNKPDVRFFEHCFSTIRDFKKEESIIVGDSLSSDILGGKNAGIHTCLFERKEKPNLTSIVPDFKIKSLDELPALLESL